MNSPWDRCKTCFKSVVKNWFAYPIMLDRKRWRRGYGFWEHFKSKYIWHQVIIAQKLAQWLATGRSRVQILAREIIINSDYKGLINLNLNCYKVISHRRWLKDVSALEGTTLKKHLAAPVLFQNLEQQICGS